ncbi:MAG: helix-turn-helix domain-containing protein [Actinobacteria bacterium]|nr:helix-turn-helix domain-containing protein [Actinomycetota bacterium]MCB9412660.1 helix-turn-helix domain-containing protein [Actinomycetota bacterium]
MSTTEQWLDMVEAAEVLGISPRTVRRRIADGSLPAYRAGHFLRIARSDIDAMIRSTPVLPEGTVAR